MNTDTFDFRSIGRLKPDPKWQMPLHCHSFSELIVVLSGVLWVRGAATRELRVGRGEAVLYPAGCSHQEWVEANDPAETFFISFGGETTGGIRAATDIKGRIRLLSQWLYEESRVNPDDRFLHATFFRATLAEWNVCSTLNRSSPLVERIRLYILNNLDSQISLSKLAERVSMSQFHFLRTYKKLAGITPMDDVRRIRLQEAYNQVASGNLPLKRIAESTGFADQYHFSRLFKREFGVSPGQVRKAGYCLV